MTRLQKRTAVLFILLMACTVYLMFSVYTLTMGGDLMSAAARQSSYQLQVAQQRGAIYDRAGTPLTGTVKETLAAVTPGVDAANSLTKALPKGEMQNVLPLLQEGKPFLLRLPGGALDAEEIDCFSLTKRYSGGCILPHVIGYLDGSGAGVAGVEQSFDDYLSNTGAAITVTYQVDALGRVLPGEEKQITDRSALEKKGVMLTVDQEIQQLALHCAKKYLKKGAVLVAEIPTCDLRAVVSLPDFDPADIAPVLNDPDAPLINRAFSAYSVGSVFKLVTAAAALEAGISPEETYNCNGSIHVDGFDFHCFNGQGHGTVDMNNAIAYSCNTYFIQLAQKVGADKLLQMAQKLGFGSGLELAPGLASDAGNLPDPQELELSRALANFSFGQGSLTATPLQFTALVNAIASGGDYTQPRLVEGLVDETMQFVERYAPAPGGQVLSAETAARLMGYMRSSVEYGTSAKGKPTAGGAGAKTATAETGQQEAGRDVVQAWYTGFFPAEQPRYVIVVLAEDGDGGGASCGPVFKDIADGLYRMLMAGAAE